MAEVDGKVVMKDAEGRLYRVPKEQVETTARDLGWTHAGDEETAARVKERQEYAKYGSTGQQALAAGEQAVRTATFGLAPGIGSPEDIAGREKVLREESPVVSMGAQALGAAAPALLTGGAATGIAGAAGLGARGASVASMLAEGAVGGLAEEVEQARFETRDVSAGNVMLFGLGGEVVGRMLPKGLAMGAGKVKRALSAVDEAAGEGLGDALAGAEARSAASHAKAARGMPKGSPERLEALRATASEQYDTMSKEAAEDLDAIVDATSRMGDTSSSKRVTDRLKETIADPSPKQVEYFTGVKSRLSEAKARIRSPIEAPAEDLAARAPVSLEGKSLEQLKALPLDRGAKEETLTALRTGSGFGDQFAKTGRVKEHGPNQGIQVEMGPDGPRLRDGRHRLTVAREQGRETVYGQIFQGQRAPGKAPIYEGEIRIAPAKAAAPAELSADLKTIAKRFDQVVDTGLKRLDKTDDAVESFLIARDIKKQLQHVSKKMGLMKSPQDEFMRDEMRGVIDDTWREINAGLKDKSLFGAAADIESEINSAWSDKVLRGLGISESDLARKVDVDFKTGRTIAEFDPAKARSFFQQDSVGRTITQRKLDQLLEGAEEMAEAHGRHGTWDTDEIAQLRERVGRMREKLGLADELQVAKRAEVPKANKGSDWLGEAAEFGLETALGGAIPFAGQFIKMGKRLLGLNSAGQAATKQTARNLAGVGLGYTQRALEGASKAAPVPAMTALARFTGDYSGPEESFEAKRKLLDEELTQPEVLYEVLGTTLGDLPRVNPELYQAIASNVTQKVRYLRENMPAGLTVSMMYPNGTPPSRSAIRDWATMWNTAMDPETVLEDIDNGTVTPLQMETLRATDAELYEQLRNDTIEYVGANFKSVPTSTKIRLDMIFDADGLAGPMFSSSASRMIGDAMTAKAQQKPSQNPSAGSSVDAGEATGAKGPAGLSSIQSSVTNAGAAA